MPRIITLDKWNLFLVLSAFISQTNDGFAQQIRSFSYRASYYRGQPGQIYWSSDLSHKAEEVDPAADYIDTLNLAERDGYDRDYNFPFLPNFKVFLLYSAFP